MKRFEDKVVVVTGTSSGLGRCTAKMFTEEGAKVVGMARREELMKELQAEISSEGGTFEFCVGDITEANVPKEVIDYTIDKFGKIDILVNNAGADDYTRFVLDTTDDFWDYIIALNLTAPFRITREALEHMVHQESGGNIVNVGSIAGLRGVVGGASYTAAKHGLVGLTKNVARAYVNQNIRCNIVCPAGMKTRLCTAEHFTKSPPENKALSRAACAASVRVMEPEEVARVILFLASDDAKGVNGAIVSTDGGFAAS